MQYGSAELRIKETKDKTKRAGMDISFLALVVILLAIGVTMVLSASFARAYFDPGGVTKGKATYYFIRQFIFAALGVAAMIICSRLPVGFYKRFSMPVLIAAVILLMLGSDNRNERKRSKALDRPWGIYDPAVGNCKDRHNTCFRINDLRPSGENEKLPIRHTAVCGNTDRYSRTSGSGTAFFGIYHNCCYRRSYAVFGRSAPYMVHRRCRCRRRRHSRAFDDVPVCFNANNDVARSVCIHLGRGVSDCSVIVFDRLRRTDGTRTWTEQAKIFVSARGA